MKRYSRQILVLFLTLMVFCIAARLLSGSTYLSRITLYTAPVSVPEVVIDHPDVVRVEITAVEDNRISYEAVPLRQGDAMVSFLDEDGNELQSVVLKVGQFRTIYNLNNGGFTGELVLMSAITVFLLLLSAMMLHGFLSAKGAAFYAYSTVFYIGFFFFALSTGLTMLNITLRHIVQPGDFSMMSVYSAVSGAGYSFMLVTSPLLLLFSAALAVSNIALLCHNRPRVQNVLGLLLSLLIAAGGAFAFWLCNRDFAGSLAEYRLTITVENVYCTAYAYFECILAGAAVCALRAARHQPPADRDVIIVLGCWFRKDGSLPPLLRGRADAAVRYWKRHLQETGREAFVIPSGGQGRDESMPEAEAIRRYLIAQGIPENRILPETRSGDTLRNMSYSREIMEENGLTGDAVFCTTSYHVFRGGLYAAQAGLKAEGIGSRTRWWFWPNAFVREWIGLIANKWKRELVLLLMFILLFGLLSATTVG